MYKYLLQQCTSHHQHDEWHIAGHGKYLHSRMSPKIKISDFELPLLLPITFRVNVKSMKSHMSSVCLFQVLDANACFEKQPPSALSLQLAAYYYSLQIYSRLAPCFKDKCSPLYRVRKHSVSQFRPGGWCLNYTNNLYLKIAVNINSMQFLVFAVFEGL